MVITEFRPEHINAFDFGGVGDQFRGAFLTPENIAVMGEKGAVWCAVEDSQVLCMSGICILWRGVGEAWALMVPEALRHFKAIHRKAQEVVDTFFDTGVLVRLHTSVLKGFTPGYRWVEHLGFHWEGEMERYGPDGRDYIRFARIAPRRED